MSVIIVRNYVRPCIITNMGKKKEGTKIEERIKQRMRKNALRDTLLVSAYTTVAVGMAIMAPNSLQLLKQVKGAIGPSPRLKRRISQKYSELVAQGIFERRIGPRGSEIILTEKGAQLGEEISLRKELKLSRPKKWDRKWRVIMFDVWERRRNVRDRLRRMLEEVGFMKIQDSVWVYPYPCEDLLIFLRKSLKLGPSILYMVVDEIERDESLRRHFNLPLE